MPHNNGNSKSFEKRYGIPREAIYIKKNSPLTENNNRPLEISDILNICDWDEAGGYTPTSVEKALNLQRSETLKKVGEWYDKRPIGGGRWGDHRTPLSQKEIDSLKKGEIPKDE